MFIKVKEVTLACMNLPYSRNKYFRHSNYVNAVGAYHDPNGAIIGLAAGKGPCDDRAM